MKFRTWLSLITLTLLAILVVAAWGDIREAFGYLGKVNLWILTLMIPVQFISYFATGEMVFTYLRSKGNLKNLGMMKATRMSLEVNFVNHVFPSGGAAGLAYFSWLLGKYGVSAGRAAMAQVVRFALTFIAFGLILVIALAALVVDHTVAREVVVMSTLLVGGAIFATVGGIYILKSRKRLNAFGAWITRVGNRIVAFFTFGKKKNVIQEKAVDAFFNDLHDDYVSIGKDKKILIKPFLWSIMNILMDIVLIYIAFLSFGVEINFAYIVIAYGLSSIASAAMITPGGAGAYEAVMIAFLGSAGVPLEIAIAGTLLARVILMLGTIVFGYVFYQLTVLKYGKAPVQRQ